MMRHVRPLSSPSRAGGKRFCERLMEDARW